MKGARAETDRRNVLDLHIADRFPATEAAPKRRWPQYDDDEIDAVCAVLRSGRVNAFMHGEQSRAFEREFADYCGAPFAIAVANGTLALELALRSLSIGPGDEVIVPARSFFATTSCVVAVGATPVFADIDPVSHTIDVESIRSVLSPRTRAVICVHLGGWPCDMPALIELCRGNNLYLVEDCAQAHGAALNGKRVGSFGDAAAFSFCTDKIMSTGGEGGLVLLQDRAHWARAWAYKDHGKDPTKIFNPSGAGAGFRYVHDSFGSNFRMTELQAVIGRIQLAKLPSWLRARNRNAEALARMIDGHPAIDVVRVPEHVECAFYRFYLMLNPAFVRHHPASEVISRLNAIGIPAAAGSCPDMSRELAFSGVDVRRAGDLTNAADVGRRAIALPVDHLLTREEMVHVALSLVATIDDLTARLPA